MVLSDCYSLANEQFGHARLGDQHRTRRLVSLASSLAQHAGLSIVKSSQSTAQVEGAYRLIRNPSVSPQAIAEAGFTATVRACEAHPLLLALEDTTTMNRPGFPGECFICELRLPDHRFRWKHNKLFLLLPEEYGPAFPAIVDCYTSPPT